MKSHCIYPFIAWLLSLRIIVLRFIHIVEYMDSSFLWLQYFIICIYYNSLIHSLICGQLSCFQLLAITDKTGITLEYKYLYGYKLLFLFEKYLRVELYGRYMFKLLRNC